VLGALWKAGGKKMRPIVQILTVAVVLTLVTSGVALAARITCPNVSGTNECIGTKNNDRLLGSSRADNMSAGKGDDVLRGREGDDNAMRGNAGRDRLYGGPGHDQLGGGTGKDVLEGGGGFDTYFFFENNWGKETIVDTPIVDADINTGHSVRFDGVTNDLIIDLNSRAEHGVRMRNGTLTNTLDWDNDLIDIVTNDGKGDDIIIGRLVADNIQPSAGGTDSINARSGDDFIYTVDGVKDDIECGDGDDTVRKDTEDTASHCETVNNF
jgi:RTX calcium-binding nonapeptide repeat (4 copies)